MKVLLILVDGMRPDALEGAEEAKELFEKASYTLSGTTVMPSMTLPCHMSLFHSVDPLRHGTTTNTYAPQVRPIKGLCELLHDHGKSCSFFYNWAELRDLTKPGSLQQSYLCNGEDVGYQVANEYVTEAALRSLKDSPTDFTFLYLGYSDMAGHRYGWMSAEYLDAVKSSLEKIHAVLNVLTEEYTVIITADHGGHGRCHGTDLPEDMTIPMLILGKDFTVGENLPDANIMDIAPTVAKLFGLQPDAEWEGKSLL